MNSLSQCVHRILLCGFVLMPTVLLAQSDIKPQHALAMHGEPRYGAGETFDYVNPQAPVGGELKMGVIGSFDSLNPFITKGKAPTGLYLPGGGPVYPYDALMCRSGDEPFTLYGLLVETVEVPADRSSITFNLRQEAKWADGQPVTAQDVRFSYETFKEKGIPNLRLFFSKIANVEIIGERRIKFSFNKLENEDRYDPELPMLVALMKILPAHELAGKDIETIFLTPILGSGPYRIKSFEPGHNIVYERRPDYWGWNVLCNKGKYNFATIRVDYYRNVQVAREAFKAGAYDILGEDDANAWEHMSDWPAVKDGRIIKTVIPHSKPVGVKSLVFNTRRFPFNDPRVRQALAYGLDFEWVNKNLFHDRYVRTRSFFDNTELAHRGPPAGKELELLEPFRDQLPKELFVQEYNPPSAKGYTQLRHNISEGKKILQQADWKTTNGKLHHSSKKEPLSFEILLHNPADEKIALSFARTLEMLGIKAKIRTVDPAQYEARRLQFDYDVLMNLSWGQTNSPGREQTFYYNSKFAEQSGSRNYPGIKDPVVDHLCEVLATAHNRETQIAAARALDRVLTFSHYVLFLYHEDKHFLAYWDKFGHPPFRPNTPVAPTTWWHKDLETQVATAKPKT